VVVEALDHAARDDGAVRVVHFARRREDHEHVVAVVDPHGVQIRKHVGARDLALLVRVLDERVEKVGGLHEAQALVPRRHDRAVHPDLAVANALQEREKVRLRDLAPSSFELCIVGQAEVGGQPVGRRVVHIGGGEGRIKKNEKKKKKGKEKFDQDRHLAECE
jgi:hypothetical protein